MTYITTILVASPGGCCYFSPNRLHAHHNELSATETLLTVAIPVAIVTLSLPTIASL